LHEYQREIKIIIRVSKKMVMKGCYLMISAFHSSGIQCRAIMKRLTDFDLIHPIVKNIMGITNSFYIILCVKEILGEMELKWFTI
jgi:hypothetical protein